jgi:HEAT repeat protein
MPVDEHLARLDAQDAIDAVIFFADNPEPRALDALVRIATDPNRMDDEQHYAAEACCALLGPQAFVQRFVAEFESGKPWNKGLALRSIISWAPEQAQTFIDSCVDAEQADVLQLALGSASHVGVEKLRALLEHSNAGVVEAARERLRADGYEVDAAAVARRQLEADDLENRRSGIAFFAESPSVEVAPRLGAIALDQNEPDGLRQRALEAIAATRDPETLPLVLAVFDSDDERSTSLAARAVGTYEDPDMVPRLGRFLLAPGDEFLHAEAAHGLATLGHASAAPYLIEALGDSRYEVRQWSACALGCIDLRPSDRKLVARALEGVIADGGAEVRGYAIRSLGAIGEGDSLELLHELATGDDLDAAWDVAWALDDFDSPESLDTMRRLFDRLFVDVAWPAANYLERHGSDDDYDRAISMVERGERMGFRLLGVMKHKWALDAVLEHMPKAKTERLLDRVYALGAAARLGHDVSRVTLREMVGDAEGWAAIELLRIGDEAGLQPTIAAARGPYFDVVEAAIDVLGDCGDPAAEPVLRELFEGPHPEHRRSARRALARLQNE